MHLVLHEEDVLAKGVMLIKIVQYVSLLKCAEVLEINRK